MGRALVRGILKELKLKKKKYSFHMISSETNSVWTNYNLCVVVVAGKKKFSAKDNE